LAGLAVAGLSGQSLQPKPAAGAQTTIEGRGMTLHLAGRWKSRQAPRLPAFHLRAPVAAASNSSVIVAGHAPAAGPQLLSRDARASLPPAARPPTPVSIDHHAALRFGSTAKLGVAQEILALPLRRDVLVIRCTGSAAPLARLCAQAVAGMELRNGSMQPLAPTAATARRLRAATDRLGAERQRQRSLLAAASSRQALAAAAEKLASANRLYADRLTSLPTTAQDANSIGGAVSAARATAVAYADLVKVRSSATWGSARAAVDQREKELDGAIRRLRSLRVYEG
jgi:hypothetical protein